MTHGIQKHLQCKKKKKWRTAGFKVCAWEEKWQNFLVEIKTVVLALPWANKCTNSKTKCAYICSWLCLSYLLSFRNKEDIWRPSQADYECNSLGQVELLGTYTSFDTARTGLSIFLPPLDQKCIWFHTSLCDKSCRLLLSQSMHSKAFLIFTEGPVEPTEPSLKSPWGWLAIRGANRLKWCFFGAVRLELR